METSQDISPVAWLVNHKNGQFITIVRSIAEKEFYERYSKFTSPLYAHPDPRLAALEATVKSLQQNDMATVMLRRRVEKLEALLRDWIECKRDKLELFDATVAALGKEG